MDHNVYVTGPIPELALADLSRHCSQLDIGPAGSTATRDVLLAGLAGRDAVLCSIRDRMDAQAIQAVGPSCQVLASFGVGVDHIDLEAARSRGIVVTNTPGVLTDATADLTWALILATARQITQGDRFARSGRWEGWEPLQMLGLDITNKTLGIVGAGRIGTAVGLRSVGFRMKICYVGHRASAELDAVGADRVDLRQCLAEADFVTLHMPLTDDTRHLVGEVELGQMKASAILINTARGPVVDEKALIVALSEGQIAGAGLDVYEREPAIPEELAKLENVVCLPHLGSATIETRLKMGQIAVANLLAVLSGKAPINPV